MRAVIFDMFETLITHYNCPLYFSAQIAEDLNIPTSDFQRLWFAMEDDRTMGRLSLEEALLIVMDTFHCHSLEKLEEICRKRRAVKEACFLHLDSQILPMLDALRTRGVKTGLVSNCFSEEAPVIRESVLFPFFDAVCLSVEEGVRKPDPTIFCRCCDRLGVQPREVLYVGDGGSNELSAARDLGMQAVQATWYLRDDLPQPCHRLPEFPEAKRPLDLLTWL